MGRLDRGHARPYRRLCCFVVACRGDSIACDAVSRQWLTGPGFVRRWRENSSTRRAASLSHRHYLDHHILRRQPQIAISAGAARDLGRRVRRDCLRLYEFRGVAVVGVSAAHAATPVGPHHWVSNYCVLYRNTDLAHRSSLLETVMTHMLLALSLSLAALPVITLERTICYGTCPAYKLTIFD